jgi:hypothetical protein
VTDEECLKLLEQGGTRAIRPFARRPWPGKHNMAKGAVPVEDAAVYSFLLTSLSSLLVFQALGFRATLERNSGSSRGLQESTTEGG